MGKINWKEVKALYEQGKTQNELCKKFNISLSSMGYHMKKMGADKYFYVDWVDLFILYETGNYTKKQLSKLYNVSVSVISLRLSKEGILKGDPKSIRLKNLAKLYEKGNHTREELADKFNLSESSMTKELKKMGVFPSNHELGRMTNLYLLGEFTAKQIGGIFACSGADIINYMKKNNIASPSNISSPSMGYYSKTRAKEYKDKWLRKPAKVYIINMKDNKGENFFKIGITTQSIDKRISQIKQNTSYICEVLYLEKANLYESVLIEQKIIDKYKKHQHNPYQKFGGYTECFSMDVYDLIQKELTNYFKIYSLLAV